MNTTPIIADLDGDGSPEIIFESFAPPVMTALRADCSVYFSFVKTLFSNLAVADLDRDGHPEIVAVNFDDDKIIVFDHQGQQVAIAPTAPTQLGSVFPGQPTIGSVDGQASPVIVIGGQVLRYVPGKPLLTEVWHRTPQVSAMCAVSIIADIDGDSKPEVISGRTIWDGATGVDKTPPLLKALTGSGGYAAVADFNGDGRPELVLVEETKNKEEVSVYDFANRVFLLGPFLTPSLGSGPPTVADYDGDGQPEFAVASIDRFQVFDLKCAVATPPIGCDEELPHIGVRWKKSTRDVSSWSTGSSAFDLTGDGIPEAIYRDECWLRIYDGKSGRTLSAHPMTSSTWVENPTVADLDGDGHAEIIVTADEQKGPNFPVCPGAPEVDTGTPWTGPTHGLFVFHDPLDRWAPARRLWNQNAYHVTNVNDDLTVPAVEKPSWVSPNSYKAQPEPPKPTALPDFTAAQATGMQPGSPDCAAAWTLRAMICNRGAIAGAAGVPGTFYASDPLKPKAIPICTATTGAELAAGDCTMVSCDWIKPPSPGPIDLWFRVDDDGTRAGVVRECKAHNDSLALPQALCAP